MKKIVIVGAGGGGTITANTLAHNLSKEIDSEKVSIQVIGEREEHIFEPGSLDVAFKGVSPKKYIHKERLLLDSKVKFSHNGVAKVNFSERSIKTNEGTLYDYDYLALATGSVARPDIVEGLKESSLSFHMGPAAAAKIWQALQGFKHGKVIVATTSVPYKCPPSPNEAAFMLDEFFRKKGVRDSVEIKFLTPYPRAYSAQIVSDVVQPMFEERGIEVIPFFMADRVDKMAKKIYSLEGEGHDYDLLIAIPPHRGAEVISSSGIGDTEGWIPTDKRTLRAKDQSDVYAIGDATNIPISKSGVVAHLESCTVSKNIESDLTGASELFEYSGRINCPMETGRRQALFIAGTYSEPPPRPKPTFIRYVMKKGFGKMYWSALTGRWDWIFDVYFGKTSSLKIEAAVEQEKAPQMRAA